MMSSYTLYSLPFVMRDGSVWAMADCEAEPFPRLRRLAVNPVMKRFAYWQGAETPAGQHTFEAAQALVPDIRWATVDDLTFGEIPAAEDWYGVETDFYTYTAEQIGSDQS